MLDVGTPSLDIGSRLAVNILPSDDAQGVFGFSASSLSLETEEGGVARLSVVRTGGDLGTVRVWWGVEGGEGDVYPTSGYLEFEEGVVEVELSLNVTDDQVHTYVCMYGMCVHTHICTCMHTHKHTNTHTHTHTCTTHICTHYQLGHVHVHTYSPCFFLSFFLSALISL